jgi:hypothetical protein
VDSEVGPVAVMARRLPHQTCTAALYFGMSVPPCFGCLFRHVRGAWSVFDFIALLPVDVTAYCYAVVSRPRVFLWLVLEWALDDYITPSVSLSSSFGFLFVRCAWGRVVRVFPTGFSLLISFAPSCGYVLRVQSARPRFDASWRVALRHVSALLLFDRVKVCRFGSRIKSSGAFAARVKGRAARLVCKKTANAARRAAAPPIDRMSMLCRHRACLAHRGKSLVGLAFALVFNPRSCAPSFYILLAQMHRGRVCHR